MRLISIDPGPTQSAYVTWDTEKDDFLEVILYANKGLINNQDLYASVPELLSFQPEIIAIEMIQSYGTPLGRPSFETILFVGKLTGEFERQGARETFMVGGPLKVKYYGRPTIKGQVGGKNDTQIRASLRLRYGEAKKGCKLEGVKKDIWAALALATALTERPNLKEW